mmetsp:Transcript_36163/g.65594  ORF Transcript_36163/g.65594 Transcript_36163/m.65594 type:complete len:170 (+) Transcript_36163:3-512(+)
MLAKAEWERQVRAEIEAREQKVAQEGQNEEDERRAALEAIKREMEEGQIYSAPSRAPSTVIEEDEEGLEDDLAKAAAEAKLDDELLRAFLAEHGFSSINAKRRKMIWTSCPLHVAAERKDAKMVGLLLRKGADPALKNSFGRTAAQVAEKMNKNESHSEVLRALAAATL